MRQQNISVLTLTLIASGSVVENRAVGFDGTQATTQGQKVMGSAMTVAANGEILGVITHGTVIMETGAAIAVGDSIITDNQGRAIPATGVLAIDCHYGEDAYLVDTHTDLLQGADLPEFVFADALQPANAAGEFIEVLLRR